MEVIVKSTRPRITKLKKPQNKRTFDYNKHVAVENCANVPIEIKKNIESYTIICIRSLRSIFYYVCIDRICYVMRNILNTNFFRKKKTFGIAMI